MPITIPTQVPIVGGQTIGPPDQSQQQQAPDTSARDVLIAQYAAAHKGQMGSPAPVYIKGSSGVLNADPNGFQTYTFGDGTTVDLSPTGQVQNEKLAASSTKTPTASEALAQAGIYSVGNQVWQRNADGTYSQTDSSQAQQQLTNQATQAKTNLDTLNAQKQQIDNAALSDPTNIQLKQQQQQLANQVSQANIDKTNADIANQALTTQLNQQKTQSDIATAQGNLQVSQGNLAVNQQKTASDIATQTGNLQIAQAKLPGDISQQQATLQGTQITNQAALAKLNQPTMLSTGTGPTYTYWDPATQSMQTAANPAYVPTDPGRMTAQLQQQAAAQQQALQQQVAAGKITSDQAASQFDQYWNQNIEPVKGDIAAAQAKAQSALQYQQAQTGYQQAQTAMLPATLAQNASDAAQRNVLSMLPYTVGAGAATTPGITPGARGFPNVNPQQIMQNATYSLPNLQEIGRQGAAAALANISPTAAMHTQIPGPMGQPQQGMPDLNSMLNMNSYGFGTPPPPPPAAGPPPAAAAAPAGPPVGQTSYTNPGMNMALMPGYVPPTGPQTSYTIPGTDPSLMPGAPNPWGTYQPAS